MLVPRRADPERDDVLDFTAEETDAFAFNALQRRLRVIGIEAGELAEAASSGS